MNEVLRGHHLITMDPPHSQVACKITTPTLAALDDNNLALLVLRQKFDTPL